MGHPWPSCRILLHASIGELSREIPRRAIALALATVRLTLNLEILPQVQKFLYLV